MSIIKSIVVGHPCVSPYAPQVSWELSIYIPPVTQRLRVAGEGVRVKE